MVHGAIEFGRGEVGGEIHPEAVHSLPIFGAKRTFQASLSSREGANKGSQLFSLHGNRDDGTTAHRPLRTDTVLTSKFRARFGRPLTRLGMYHLRVRGDIVLSLNCKTPLSIHPLLKPPRPCQPTFDICYV